jgi:hypothetical protein
MELFLFFGGTGILNSGLYKYEALLRLQKQNNLNNKLIVNEAWVLRL